MVLGLFGLLTLVASGTLLFNIGGARGSAGAVVPIVLWMNLPSAILYIISAYGLFQLRPWAPTPLMVAAVLLMVAAIGFLVHVQAGGAFEQRTIGALAFRIVVTGLFIVAARYFVRTSKS